MADHHTPRRTGGYEFIEAYDVGAGEKIGAGQMVALDAQGNAQAYALAAQGSRNTLVVVGRCEAGVDNTDGAVGALRVRVRTGVFRWANDAEGAVLTKAHIGDAVYGHDAHTVRRSAKTGGSQNNAAAVGRLISVDADGAWVATGIPFHF